MRVGFQHSLVCVRVPVSTKYALLCRSPPSCRRSMMIYLFSPFLLLRNRRGKRGRRSRRGKRGRRSGRGKKGRRSGRGKSGRRSGRGKRGRRNERGKRNGRGKRGRLRWKETEECSSLSSPSSHLPHSLLSLRNTPSSFSEFLFSLYASMLRVVRLHGVHSHNYLRERVSVGAMDNPCKKCTISAVSLCSQCAATGWECQGPQA